ncbi:MAG: alpha/beta fold hydrolase [Deltaproteobacteria bacterium]|nr:alpha/beta fold hydrolase [Deltaproteobacteria bacterium]
MHLLAKDEHHPRTRDGWQLHLTRTWSPEHLDRSARPVVILPGYGMNAFIFGFHPRGTSMLRHFAEAGFEMWTANLRLQGDARAVHPDAGVPSLRAFAEIDLPLAIDEVLARTRSTADTVSLVGCSLGGSIAYAHLALAARSRVGALVAMGSPLRWVRVSPLLSLPTRSPWLVGMFKMSGNRRLARTLLPLLAKTPSLLSIYMNAAHVDLSHAVEMAQTVEDAHPRTNRDLARWIGARDMILRGVNVTEAMSRCQQPLLVVIGNRDGIVPEPTALSVLDVWGGRDVEVLKVGTPDDWYAHADLFIGNDAPQAVFEPVARWLRAH